MRVVVTGAHSQLGQAICAAFQARGDRVTTLTRAVNGRTYGDILFDPLTGWIESDRLEGHDAVIHLGGWARLFPKRWTSARLEEIRSSRLDRTRVVANALAQLEHKPRVLVSESTVAYYGNGDQPRAETDPPGTTFLARLTVEWEDALTPAADAGIRVVPLRFGTVLSDLRRWHAGTGQRTVSWISLRDAVRAVEHVVDHDQVAGPVNVTTPHPTTSRTLSSLPMPATVCRLVFGRAVTREVLLANQRALPVALQASGFEWTQPSIGDVAVSD